MKYKEDKVIQMDLKFQHLAALEDVREVYQYISFFKGRGRKAETASSFVVEAFKTWDPTLSPEIVDVLIKNKTISMMLKQKEIITLEDFYSMLNSSRKNELEDLPAPGRQGIKIHSIRKDEMNLHALLSKHTEKNRAFLVYIFVKNYIARNTPKEYYTPVIKRLWQQIVNFYYDSNEAYFREFVEYAINPFITLHSRIESDKEKNKRETEIMREKELKDLFG